MAQSALNDWLPLPAGEWTLFSEINCTFVNPNSFPVEVRGDTSEPEESEHGIVYYPGQGEDASTDQLGRYAAITATGLWARPLGNVSGNLFVSRASVA